ncbi:MAG: hypothetical protein PHU25_09850 [Deltaproteobacteria bacterium]|nr:hypothetical protein [Deltaproteobacteria bacterium]
MGRARKPPGGPIILEVVPEETEDARRVRLRPAHERVRRLGCWPQILDRLAAGTPMAEVSRWVQDEMGEMLDWDRGTLANRLGELKAMIPLADLLTQQDPATVAASRREFNDRLEDLRTLARLEVLAWYRMDILHGQERLTGRINPEVSKEIRNIADLATRSHSIRMDLGLTGSRDLGTLSVSAEKIEEIRQRYGEQAAAAFSDPVRRERVLSVVRQAMRLAARERGEVIDIGVDDAEPAPKKDGEES